MPDIRTRAPYAVERYPAAGSFVRLIGYNGRGEYMAELVIPSRKFTSRTVPRFERWLRDNDDDAPTRLSLLG